MTWDLIDESESGRIKLYRWSASSMFTLGRALYYNPILHELWGDGFVGGSSQRGIWKRDADDLTLKEHIGTVWDFKGFSESAGAIWGYNVDGSNRGLYKLDITTGAMQFISGTSAAGFVRAPVFTGGGLWTVNFSPTPHLWRRHDPNDGSIWSPLTTVAQANNCALQVLALDGQIACVSGNRHLSVLNGAAVAEIGSWQFSNETGTNAADIYHHIDFNPQTGEVWGINRNRVVAIHPITGATRTITTFSPAGVSSGYLRYMPSQRIMMAATNHGSDPDGRRIQVWSLAGNLIDECTNWPIDIQIDSATNRGGIGPGSMYFMAGTSVMRVDMRGFLCGTQPLRNLVADIASRAGVPASRIDVSGLDENADIWGMGIGSPASGRQMLELLQQYAHFDTVDVGRLLAIRRDRAADGIIGGDDLGAHLDGEEPPSAAVRSRTEDYEIPREVRVRYTQSDAEYEASVQLYERQLTDGQDTADIDLSALAMDADKAAQIAEISMMEAVVGRESIEFQLVATETNKALIPSDIKTLQVGASFDVVRLVQLDYAWPGIQQWRALRHDPSIYDSDAQGVTMRIPGSPFATLSTPFPAVAQALLEVPYALTDAGDRQVAALVAPDGAQHIGYELWIDPVGGTDYALRGRDADWTPTGVLEDSEYPAETDPVDETGFVIEAAIEVGALRTVTLSDELATRNVAQIGQELVTFRTVNQLGSGRVQIEDIRRGVFDTIPAAHAAGDRIWFVSYGAGNTREDGPWPVDVNLAAKALPYTRTEVLDLIAAPTMFLQTVSRFQRPYPPARVTINGGLFPAEAVGTVTVGWRGRNRLSDDAVVGWLEDVDYQPEPGTGYDIIIQRTDTDVVVFQRQGIPWVDESDGARLNIQSFAITLQRGYRFLVRSRREGLASYQDFEHELEVYGYDYRYGEKYGGDNPGEVLAKGQAPTIPPPVPGVTAQQSATFTFGGTFSASDDVFVLLTFWPLGGSTVSAPITLPGAGKSSLADFAADLASQASAALPGEVAIQLSGASVTLSTSFGFITGVFATLGGQANTTQQQAASGPLAGAANIVRYDLYQLAGGVWVVAPDSSASYGTGAPGSLRVEVAGFTLDAAQQIGPIPPAIWVDPATGSAQSVAVLEQVRAGVLGNAQLMTFVASAEVTVITAIDSVAPRPQLHLTMRPNFFARANLGLADLEPARPGGFRLLSVTGRPGGVNAPAGLAQVVSVSFSNILGSTDVANITAGLGFWVRLGGITYSYTADSGDAAAFAATGSYNGIYNGLKAAIEVGPYTVELITVGTSSVIGRMLITRDTSNVTFSFAAGAGFGVEVTYSES